jgi:hypothetical protein
MNKTTRHFKKTIIFFGVLFLICCKRNNNASNIDTLKTIIEKAIGNKLILPKDLELYQPFTNYELDSLQIKNANLKIYKVINASCGNCVNNVNRWNLFSKELDKYGVPVILVFRSTDNFELLKNIITNMNEINSFPYPFFLDNENKFVKSNSFMTESDSFMTVLTDKNNSILLIGNPLNSQEIKELYLKEIQKRLKDK